MVSGQAPMNSTLNSIAARLTDSRILFNEPMSFHTSFRIGGHCDLLVFPSSVDDAVSAWRLCRESKVPCYIVGNGTNLLVKDGGVRGCVIKMAPGFSGVSRDGSSTIEVRAGTLLPRLVQSAFEEELSGLEWAVGIPGSVGGAIAMNAGAYGGDMASVVRRVQVASLEGDVRWLSPLDLHFSYRHSLFTERNDLLILSAEFELAHGERDAIYDVMMTRASEREAKQPLDLPSAGSAFRRPQGHYVGAMIQELGLKGLKVGAAQISPKHAGFIVNTGGATANDVLKLMGIVQAKVKAAFDVDLQPEVVVIGEDAVE